MLSVPELNFGFADAENYKRRENKSLFNNIFVRTDALEHLCSPQTFFLIGEKGTGKTAYAVYLANNDYKNTNAALRYIRETEYHKFVELKRLKHLALSDYTNIWKVIIYLLLAKKIAERYEAGGVLARFSKFRSLIAAVDEYYNGAFSPEIIYAMNFVEESKLSAELLAKHAKLGGEESTSVAFAEHRFQVNLMYIQRRFEAALSSLRLDENHLLLIDGIDIRPAAIPYEDYSECVKGLANAVWSINNDFFPTIKASKGRLRTVLLIRPDIFDALGLQNQNTKIRDNAVLLDWRTSYSNYSESAIFKMVDKLLAAQQPDPLSHGQAWGHYFPFTSRDTRPRSAGESDDGGDGSSQSSFVAFLRFSFCRPRDFISMLTILQEQFIARKRPAHQVFSATDFDHPEFRRKYADYLLGEIKDHLSFYYGGVYYEHFLRFFQYLNGKVHFTYEEYLEAWNGFSQFLKSMKMENPAFFATPEALLQSLFELNVLCWIQDTDDEPFIHWCYRERSLSNISPKVKTHERYGIHYGLGKAVNTGKRFRLQK